MYKQTGHLDPIHNIFYQGKEYLEYGREEAVVLANTMEYLENKFQGGQQYIYHKGLKVFGNKGRKALEKEMGQLDDRECFKPIQVDKLSNDERRKAQNAIAYLTEKRDGTIKGRTVYNGKPTREWMNKDENASPTASLEGVFLTAIVDAHEGRDVMTTDIPNAFIQTPMPVEEGKERVIMKITGVLVDILVKKDPGKYAGFVVYENGKKVLYVVVTRAIYGMLNAGILWYAKFRADLEAEKFVFNRYDPCVANKVVDGKQLTIRFHVDDVMSSHVDKNVNDKFLRWMNKLYGKFGEVKATRGNVHDYLGMTFRFGNGEVVIDMTEYVKNMLKEFPVKFNDDGKITSTAGVDLFKEDVSKKLNEKERETFHTTVARGLFLCKRSRPDVQTAVSVLCSRVRAPGRKDWEKLVRMMKFLNNTRNDVLTLSAGKGLNCIEWYIDAAFGVHPDYRGHSGGAMKFRSGKGSPIQKSVKQKLNTSSSTTCELVGVDDLLPKVLWVPLFMKDQGYNIDNNIIYQDNTSAILLEKNGRRSCGERTRALNIRYFVITDHISKGDVRVEHCGTEDMLGDFYTKPLQGKKFHDFRRIIMGMPELP